jgi:large repetitive protein
MAERGEGKDRPDIRRFSRRIFLAGGAAVTGGVIWGETSSSAIEWEHRPPPKIPGGTGNTGNTGSSGPPRPPRPVLEFGLVYLPRGTPGVRYLGIIWVVNGRPPLTWAVTAGALPPGLILNPSDGLIGGTVAPGDAGRYTFTVTVTDSESHSISRAFTIDIA